ncbi:MAG TPA: hypothetical protein VNJ51_12640 [Candidatus Dormibacteraeota bacterium]|nr:hypothetical protein [Candidatus Dormibacteraeota bacterium]
MCKMITIRAAAMAAVAALMLSACGGGGGAAAPAGGVPPVTSTPQPSAPIVQVAAQRTASQQALSLISGSKEVSSGGGLGAASVLRRAAGAWRRPAQDLRRTSSIGTCNGGVEGSVVQTSATTATFTFQAFYDVSCQTLESTLVWNAAQTSALALSGPGNATYYGTSGSVIGYALFQLAGAFTDTSYTQLAQLSLDVTSLEQTVGGPSLGSFAVACGLGSQPNGLACGLGAVANLASLSQSYGATMTLSGSSAATASGTSVQASATAQAYLGTLDALTLTAGAFPAWTITGGSQVDQASGSLTALYDANGLPASLSETITDSQDQATISVTANASGISGTVTDTQTGATVATFTVDAMGFGTIAYSNGATGQIEDFVIVG